MQQSSLLSPLYTMTFDIIPGAECLRGAQRMGYNATGYLGGDARALPLARGTGSEAEAGRW